MTRTGTVHHKTLLRRGMLHHKKTTVAVQSSGGSMTYAHAQHNKCNKSASAMGDVRLHAGACSYLKACLQQSVCSNNS